MNFRFAVEQFSNVFKIEMRSILKFLKNTPDKFKIRWFVNCPAFQRIIFWRFEADKFKAPGIADVRSDMLALGRLIGFIPGAFQRRK